MRKIWRYLASPLIGLATFVFFNALTVEAFTSEQMARAYAVIHFGHNDVEVRRGLISFPMIGNPALLAPVFATAGANSPPDCSTLCDRCSTSAMTSLPIFITLLITHSLQPIIANFATATKWREIACVTAT